jgi:hypothetical protein
MLPVITHERKEGACGSATASTVVTYAGGSVRIEGVVDLNARDFLI